jgi:hypothetical protein
MDGVGASGFTFAGVRNVLVDTGNGQHDVTFLTRGQTYSGNLTINAHNGNDIISVIEDVRHGQIQGNTLITTATGNDQIFIGATFGPMMTFGGNVTVTDVSGVDSVNVGSRGNTSILGSLSITGVQNVLLSGFLRSVGGGTSIQDGGIGSSAITIATPKFGKFLNITGGSGADFLTLSSGFFFGAAINGNTNISLGSGDDIFTIPGPLTFNGNFNYTDGNGNNSVDVADGQTFNGNVTFNLGSGADTFTLEGTTSTISGNLSIQAGSGNNSITTGAVVFGNLTMQLGNGNNTIVVNPSAAPTGLFSLNAGNGNSSVSLTPGAATAFNIAFRFGTGTDTLTLGATASTISGSLLSQDSGGNDFDNAAGWTILPPWTSNF